jgi:hypothetical protein
MTSTNKTTFNIDNKTFDFEHTYPININEHIESIIKSVEWTHMSI